jgi:DUF1365 family protein
MPFVFLDELEEVTRRHWTWRTLIRFRRADFVGPVDEPLRKVVAQRVSEELGRPYEGRVALLAQWRMWGFHFNPLSLYYCFDSSGESLEAVALEVRNTPWLERHLYVVDGASGVARFDKVLHVSPFLGMDQSYEFHFSTPGESCRATLVNWRGSERVFDASLSLTREDLTSRSMARVAWMRGWENLAVTVRIYLQAARLARRRAPFHSHPAKETEVTRG